LAQPPAIFNDQVLFSCLNTKLSSNKKHVSLHGELHSSAQSNKNNPIALVPGDVSFVQSNAYMCLFT